MPKFLIQGSYSPEGNKGVLKEGASARKAVIERLVAGMKGKLEAMYFGLGSDDYYIIADVPDLSSAAAVKLVVNSSGMTTARSTILLTVEEVDAACKATHVDYRPPKPA